jgi:hypothetical protein
MDGWIGAHRDAEDLVVDFARKGDVGVTKEEGEEGFGAGAIKNVIVPAERVAASGTSLMVGKPLMWLPFTKVDFEVGGLRMLMGEDNGEEPE